MALSTSRVHPSAEMAGWSHDAGSSVLSRQSHSLPIEMLSSSKPQHSSSLEEAYWKERRRKVGLRGNKDTEKKADDEFLKVREDLVKFVREHFHQKECRLFIPKSDQVGNGKSKEASKIRCKCGDILSMHAGMRNRNNFQFQNCFLVPPEFASVLNNPNKIIKEELPSTHAEWREEDVLHISPTNAFGRMHFNVEQIGGQKPAKFVRVTPEDRIEDCLELFTTHWRMMQPQPPNLVISVVGGAKNFKLDSRMRDVFANGLIKAAKTTKAWFITSGFNMGVMKAVGQAVQQGQSFIWDDERVSHLLRCIGIAPWGYVRGRQFLESHAGTGKFNAYYRTSNQIYHDEPVPLNPYHTHFVFVDDGYRNRYGGVAEFRSKLEKKIASGRNDGGLGIPLVQILVEGGYDAIKDVSATISEGIPVVVCAGTGRAADIITYAYNHTNTNHNKERVMSEYHQDKLARKIYAAYKKSFKPGQEKGLLESLMKMTMNCCKREDLITIFHMGKHEDLDLAILSVLLKGKNNVSQSNQLQLAFTWNRADIAQEEIFREDVNWKEGSLDDVLTQALIENKLDFVKLLLNNGIIMRDYLTISRLEHLYNSLPKHHYLHVIMATFSRTDEFSVNEIGRFLTLLLDKYEDDKFTYEAKTRAFNRRNQAQTKSPMRRKKSAIRRTFFDSETDADEEDSHFKHPFKQLLIWSVLCNRPDMSRLFWELGTEPIASALVATRVCLEMETKVPKYLQIIRNSFHEMKNYFEDLAISVLDECHAEEPDKAVILVERQSPTWSQLTCLQIATAASDQAFVSSVAAQNSISNVWKSGIVSSWPQVFLGALFPPLIFIFVSMNPAGNKKMSWTEKILIFYTAPLTKFILFTVSYAGFLALFSFMVLLDFKSKPSVTEWLCVIWIMSFLIGGIHAFYLFPSPTLGSKVRDYFGSMDRLDAFNLVLSLIAFCVRWDHIYDAKVIYCVNAVIFYIRVMKLYTGNRNLGPKIYMINKMIAELIMFIMVLLVFLLAYGVASQGLLYKNRNQELSVFKDIMYFPYWQLYGEIYLEELETDEVCTSALRDSFNGTLLDEDNTCRSYHPLVPILLALYLLIGNVLLLNLLIAIFSHVFETVEQNAIEIWKFQMYFLVMEFQNRPFLFPPLCLISYTWYFLQWIWSLITCKRKEKAKQYSGRHMEFLSLFEKEMMANKLRLIKSSEMDSVQVKLNFLQARMDELTNMIEEEIIAEQHAMMAATGLEGTLFNDSLPPPVKGKEIQLDLPAMGKIEPSNDLQKEPPVVEEEKKKHKHKKKDKKDKEEKKKQNKPPVIVEEEQFNISLPEPEKKSAQVKMAFESDEENASPFLAQGRVKTAADSTPKVSEHSFSLPKLSEPSSGKATLSPKSEKQISGEQTSPGGSQSRDISLVRPGLMRRISRRMEPVLSDSEDEPPVPVDIYSPRASSITVDSVRFNSLGHKSENEADNSSEDEVVLRPRRHRRLRHNQSRRSDELSSIYKKI